MLGYPSPEPKDTSLTVNLSACAEMMIDSGSNSWRPWVLRRIVMPLVVASVAACTLWGQSVAIAYIVVPFATLLWLVLARSATRKHMLRETSPTGLALRSWHALDLLSGLLLAVFETSIGACAAQKALAQWRFIGLTAGFFFVYVLTAVLSQSILNDALVAVAKEAESAQEET